jgi:MFS family permease
MAYAAVWGMRKDTHLVNQEYSWLGSIFYFGYLGALVPCLYLVNKIHIGRFIGVIATLWGIVIMCMAACQNFAGLATVRFFLGVFEAGILPAFMVLQIRWWKVSWFLTTVASIEQDPDA